MFYRGQTGPGAEPWTVREEVPKGWELASLKCTHGASAVTIDRDRAEVAITLAAADTVTCTYVDRLAPTEGELLLRKVTEGGVGAFRYRVVNAAGEQVVTRRIETDEEGAPAYAKAIKLKPGGYTVLERSPRDPKGVWRTTEAACNGRERGGRGAAARFTITVGFDISSADNPGLELRQFAVVKKEGEPVRAQGDPSRRLPLGTYSIQEFATHEQERGSWELLGVICNGRVRPFEQGRVTVRLSRSAPRLACKFVDRFTVKPEPEPSGPELKPGGPEPDLTLEKRLLSTSEDTVPTQVFLVTVRNPTSVAAAEVSVADQPGPGLAVIAAKPSQGSCVLAAQVFCSVGTIPAGGSATIRVTTRNYSTTGTYNRAVVGSASADAEAENNVATASVARGVRPAPPVPCRVADPVAQASC